MVSPRFGSVAGAQPAAHVPTPRVPQPAAIAVREVRASYARTNFLYCTRCGWSASGPFRRFRSSMYDW